MSKLLLNAPFIILAFYVSSAEAADPLPVIAPFFADHMVFPRDRAVPVWGWTKPGQRLHISMLSANADVVAGKDGRWQAMLGPLPAGGPYELAVEGGDVHVHCTDVLVGDVWLCAGQSNMEFGVAGANGGQDEIAQAANITNLRLLGLGHRLAGSPASTLPGDQPEWRCPDSGSVAGFSAVGWFTGRRLAAETKIPIGIIACAWSGSNIKGWMSDAALGGLGMYADERDQLQPYAAIEAKGGALVSAQERAANPGVDPGTLKFQGGPESVTMLYNGGIAPLAPFGLKGVIYYQGEQDAGNPAYYHLLPALISDWRRAFQQPKLPFVIVQLPCFRSPVDDPVQAIVQFGMARDAQFATARSVAGVGLAVTVDLGEADNVHPKRKAEVGDRAAHAALAVAYGRDDGGGPMYSGMTVEGRKVRLRFDHIHGGLELKPGPRSGFAVSSGDGTWHAATAVVEKNTVIVTTPEVTAPTAVRYAWAENPPVTLYDLAGMPASPFRSDSD